MLELFGDAFVRPLAMHVSDHYRHGVRYCGILSPRGRNKFMRGYSSGWDSKRDPVRKLSWRESMKKYFGFDPMIDSLGQEMHWV